MQINKLDNSYSRLGIETVECGCNCVYEDTTSLIKPTAGYKTTWLYFQTDFERETVACAFKWVYADTTSLIQATTGYKIN